MRIARQQFLSRPMRIASYGASGCLLALTLALILEGAFELSLPLGWLIGINTLTLVIYRIDKLNGPWADASPKNEERHVRIPVPVLQFLALVGGSPAALVSILLLPHKIRETQFLTVFALIVIGQVVAVFLLRERLF